MFVYVCVYVCVCVCVCVCLIEISGKWIILHVYLLYSLKLIPFCRSQI